MNLKLKYIHNFKMNLKLKYIHDFKINLKLKYIKINIDIKFNFKLTHKLNLKSI